MKRSLKNIIMISLIIIIGVCSYFTMKNTQESNVPGQKMDMEQQGTLPEMPSGSNDNNKGEPPEKPNEGNSSQAERQTPPERPEGESRNSNKGNRPTKPDENNKSNKTIIFVIEGLGIAMLVVYIIMSKFNKLTLKETLNNSNSIILFIIITIIVTVGLTIAQVYIAKNISSNDMKMIPGGNTESASVTKTGATTVDGTTQTLADNYTTSTIDESSILVQNGGNATIEGAEVTKTEGDSSNTENSEFYGVNAGILVTEKSTATIKNANISTNAKGSNAVFSTGTDSKIYISDSKITTTGSGSARGLDATYGGYIEADNVEITTQGGSCATLATDRGEGTVIAKNSKLETNGSGSPVIYSTGNISIENTEGTANGSQMVVIEGKNSATVTNSELVASGKGNRGETDNAGIMIYQSMSGDAGEGTGTFTAKNSSLSIQENSDCYKTAPMFFITNTDAIINLDNCKLSYGSNILISNKGTTEWGNSGNNGGNLTLNADNQELNGNIEIGNISTLKMNLTKSSYNGTINAQNTAKEINIKLDSDSKITLTGDSYITSLEDEDTSYSNINFNGYKLYVNGTSIN